MLKTNITQTDKNKLDLNSLLEITEAINNNCSENDLYKIYRFTLLATLGVEKMALFVKEDCWVKKVDFGIEVDKYNDISFKNYEQTKITQTLSDSDVLYQDFDLVIPIWHKDNLLALVFLGGHTPNELSSTLDTTFLEALTNVIIVAIENKKLVRRQIEQEALNKELEIAKQVQTLLFPHKLPSRDKIEISAHYQPHHGVGGDYYDYIKISDDKFLVCIADVSGKGVPAALIMSNFQASLHTLIRQTCDIKDIVAELNYLLNQSTDGEIFISSFVAIYDDLNKEFEFVNCGHNPPLFSSPEHEIKKLITGTTILGVFHPLPFIESEVISVSDGFDIFCYTDGLNEAIKKDNEQFGENRVESIFFKRDNFIPSAFNEKIMTAVDDFINGHSYPDDVTLLSMSVK